MNLLRVLPKMQSRFFISSTCFESLLNIFSVPNKSSKFQPRWKITPKANIECKRWRYSSCLEVGVPFLSRFPKPSQIPGYGQICSLEANLQRHVENLKARENPPNIQRLSLKLKFDNCNKYASYFVCFLYPGFEDIFHLSVHPSISFTDTPIHRSSLSSEWLFRSGTVFAKITCREMSNVEQTSTSKV